MRAPQAVESEIKMERKIALLERQAVALAAQGMPAVASAAPAASQEVAELRGETPHPSALPDSRLRCQRLSHRPAFRSTATMVQLKESLEMELEMSRRENVRTATDLAASRAEAAVLRRERDALEQLKCLGESKSELQLKKLESELDHARDELSDERERNRDLQEANINAMEELQKLRGSSGLLLSFSFCLIKLTWLAWCCAQNF